MGRTKKKIETFREFLKKQKMNEAKVELEIEWWDKAIVEVMQDLEDECAGCLSWEGILKYTKNKFAILGRDLPDYEEILVIQHIKDLIFLHHGDSYCRDGHADFGEYESQKIHTIGLAITELSKVILDKVMDKTNESPKPNQKTTSIGVNDQEKTTLVPMQPAHTCDDECDGDYYEDLPCAYENKRQIKKFRDYVKPVNETVAIIDSKDNESCIQYCLDRIKKETGGFDPEAILNQAVDVADGKVKARLVKLYVRPMVVEYLSKDGVELITQNGENGKEAEIPEDVINKGIEVLYDQLADDVLYQLAKINGVVENEEAE